MSKIDSTFRKWIIGNIL